MLIHPGRDSGEDSSLQGQKRCKTAALREFFARFLIGVGAAAVGITAILAILARVVKSPANLSVKDGELAPCPNSPNCVSTQSQDPRHQIDPIPYTSSPAEAKATLLQIIRSQSGPKSSGTTRPTFTPSSAPRASGTSMTSSSTSIKRPG